MSAHDILAFRTYAHTQHFRATQWIHIRALQSNSFSLFSELIFFYRAQSFSRSTPFPFVNCIASIIALTFQPLQSIATISIAQNVINHRQLANNSITVSSLMISKSRDIFVLVRFRPNWEMRTKSSVIQPKKKRKKIGNTIQLWYFVDPSSRFNATIPMLLDTFRIEAVQRTWHYVLYICASISFKTTKCIQCIRIKTSVTTMKIPNNSILLAVFTFLTFVCLDHNGCMVWLRCCFEMWRKTVCAFVLILTIA